MSVAVLFLKAKATSAAPIIPANQSEVNAITRFMLNFLRSGSEKSVQRGGLVVMVAAQDFDLLLDPCD